MTLKTRTISFAAVAVPLLALSAALLGGKVSVARADPHSRTPGTRSPFTSSCPFPIPWLKS
jgi:hypothetical protein